MVEIRTYKSESKAGVFWLTLVSLLAIAALCGLGLWQVQRLQWKKALIAQIEAAQVAPAQPLGAVLQRLKGGEDVDFVRVTGACVEQLPDRPAYLYALRDGAPAWRAISACVLDGAPYSGVLVDRGFIKGATGTQPTRVVLTAPAQLTGVLRKPDNSPPQGVTGEALEGRLVYGRHPKALALMSVLLGLEHPAPYMLLVEEETPPQPTLTAAALPAQISNRHLGYAITWFGLAAALAGVYVALLLRLLGERRSRRFTS